MVFHNFLMNFYQQLQQMKPNKILYNKKKEFLDK